ncbi:M48 family metallopeptidase, partial [Pseudomonas aeruginosa]|nr:M48 family metallopeptidase [Pseudomonas aeruginosa]
MAQPFTIEPDPNPLDHPPAFLANGGAVGKLLLSLDAASSPLGPPDAWSASLKTTMATLLPAKAQIVLFWGAEFVALYNDAYAPSIGDKHPRALGRPAIENWRELWDDLEPLLRGVWRVGQVPVSEGRTQLSVALILLGLLASAWQMLAKISRLRLRPAPALDVIGRRLGEEDAPELWTLLRELAARLDTPAPQHLLVGLCDGFYVTANRVCLQPSGEHLEGRSLYLSLPLLGLLDRAELSAVIAHELAHFAGRDAHYSLRFLPIYQGAASQLAAIEEQEANVFERAALEPARLLAGYFLERFGL